MTHKKYAILFLLTFLSFPVRSNAESDQAREIMAKSLATTKVKDSVSEMTITLTAKSGQKRIRKTTSKTRLVDGSTDNMRFVEFDSPADVKGTKTLLIENSQGDDNMWIYLPAMKKTRRLVANNKKESFVGTDFTYGDAVGHRVDDWNHKLLGEDDVEGDSCFIVESLPKDEDVKSNSGYSKRVNWVSKKSFAVRKGEIYDIQGKLLRAEKFSDVKQVDPKLNKWQPMRLESRNVQTGHRTLLELKNLKVNVGLSKNDFNVRALEK